LNSKVVRSKPDSLEDLNKQYIIEEDLLTFNVINKFEVIEDQAKASDPYGYNLYFYKKKQYLVLTYPSSLITIWDSNSKGKKISNTTNDEQHFYSNHMYSKNPQRRSPPWPCQKPTYAFFV